MAHFREVLRFCPRCGSDNFPEISPHFFRCAGGCDFHFHINASTAVGGIIPDDAGRVLLIRRGRNPGKGKWSVPGGFVDARESAETALAREVSEEVHLEMTGAEYLCSYPNPYDYRGVVFPVLDLVFVCRVRSLDALKTSEEAPDCAFLAPADIDPAEIAFPSIRYALEQFRAKFKD